MSRRYLVSLVLASSLGAQSVPPGNSFAMTKDARAQIDSMAQRTVKTHAEQSACVTTSVMRDSVFVIGVIQPAQNIIRSDSIQVVTKGPLCEWWQPSIHSHVIDNGWLEYPSPIDYHTTALRGTFGFLLSVKADGTWTMKAYP